MAASIFGGKVSCNLRVFGITWRLKCKGSRDFTKRRDGGPDPSKRAQERTKKNPNPPKTAPNAAKKDQERTKAILKTALKRKTVAFWLSWFPTCSES